jgi:hypothetical protein
MSKGVNFVLSRWSPSCSGFLSWRLWLLAAEYTLLSSPFSFLSEVLRIGAPGYCPSVQDVLWLRQKVMGIQETQIRALTLP